MKEPLHRTASALFGDARRYTLEHRLFNTISLLNGATNIGGAFAAFGETNYQFLLGLHLGTGLLFLLYYYLSRIRGLYRSLYFPFVLSIAAFLFLNTLVNAGSLGGAHYYFVPGLVIAVVLARNLMTTVVAASLFIAAAAGLFLVERVHPEWITAHAGASERFTDVLGNFVFVQVLTGALVMVLAKNLNLERAKSDVLLLNVLPESIAEELKAHERVVPRQYECASVLFADFAGFTRIAEELTPQELIEGLDQCFRAFDGIAKKHKLEKIKTIGDAYLAVGGIPSANRTHAVDAVQAALEMQRFISERADEASARDGVWWRLRVGVHTGLVIAGVIGREKFAYDVWGDTVNTASRLESSGVEGRVNISGATYELVKDYFDCEYRGRVSAKNKGEIEMYFVNGARPRLQDGEFVEMYCRLSEECSPS